MNKIPALIIVALVWTAAQGLAAEPVRVEGKSIRVEFDSAMHSRMVAILGGHERVVGAFAPSESIQVSGNEIAGFTLQKHTREPIRDRLGAGFRTILTGTAQSLKKTVT